MRIQLLAACAASLACVACGPPPAPTVDLTGVDQGKYSRDLAACTTERNETPVTFGNYISRCMEKKGYKALIRTS